jgi:hypothetical protein
VKSLVKPTSRLGWASINWYGTREQYMCVVGSSCYYLTTCGYRRNMEPRTELLRCGYVGMIDDRSMNCGDTRAR